MPYLASLLRISLRGCAPPLLSSGCCFYFLFFIVSYHPSGTTQQQRRAAISQIISCQSKATRLAIQQKADGEGFSLYDLAEATSDDYVHGDPTHPLYPYPEDEDVKKEPADMSKDMMRNQCWVTEKKCFKRSTKSSTLWYEVDNQPEGEDEDGVPTWVRNPWDKINVNKLWGPRFVKKQVPEYVSRMQGYTFSGCDRHSDCKTGKNFAKCRQEGGRPQCNYIAKNECGCYKQFNSGKADEMCRKSSTGEEDAYDMD